MKTLNQLARCYIAAIIDSEGTITIGCHRGSSTGCKRFRYQPLILLVNSNLALVRMVQHVVGFGKINARKPDNPNWSTIYRWQIVSSQAVQLAHEIRDFLIVKRDLADLLIGWPHIPPGRSKKNVSHLEEITEQSRRFNAVSKINKRGAKSSYSNHDLPDDHPLLSAD